MDSAASDIDRIAQGIVLGDGFGLFLLRCDDPVIAYSNYWQIIKRASFLAASMGDDDALVDTVCDVYRDIRGISADEVSHETLADVVLPRLVAERPDQEPADAEPDSPARRLVVIDASWAPPEHHQSWYHLFGRMNELRNKIADNNDAALLLVLTSPLYREFAGNAPDFWSIRTATMHVEVPASERWVLAPGTIDETTDGTIDRTIGSSAPLELTGRLEALPEDQLYEVVERLRLSVDVGTRSASRAAHAALIVTLAEEQNRLAELAGLLDLSAPGSRGELDGELSILHLSNLDVGRDTWAARRTWIRQVLAKVQAGGETGEAGQPRQVDVVCISGSLCQSGRYDEYELLREHVLQPLLAGLDVPRERVFWVPGPGDIDREEIDDRSEDSLRRQLTGPDKVDALLADSRIRELALARLLPYAFVTRKFFKGLLGGHRPEYFTARKCRVRGMTVGVAGLNSTWRAGAPDAELWIGRTQLVHARRALSGVDLRLALVHHPFDRLHPAEAHRAEAFCAHEFDVVLPAADRQEPDFEIVRVGADRRARAGLGKGEGRVRDIESARTPPSQREPDPESPPRKHLAPGDMLGDHLLIKRKLGRGGYATVWEAHHQGRDEAVAVKVLHADRLDNPQNRQRFLRGARIMAELDHEAVVRIIEPGAQDQIDDHGRLYFVMELLASDLRRAILDGQIPRERILPMILTVGQALAAGHERGVVHRDVKPSNVLLTAAGEAKLTDFDLVVAQGTTGGTRTGAMGTFLYAAPEMMEQPQDADARADVYSLAMTAVFALHGENLPLGVMRDTDAFVDGLDCSQAVKSVLKRALDWEVEKRYPDAGGFCAALQEAMEVQGAPDAPVSKLAEWSRTVAVAALAMAAIFAFGVYRWTVPGQHTDIDCREIEESRFCVQQVGCQWGNFALCTGASWRCTQFRYQDECTVQQGCAWDGERCIVRAELCNSSDENVCEIQHGCNVLWTREGCVETP